MQGNEESVQVVESAQQVWGLPLQPVGCSHCGQTFLLRNVKSESICPNCAQALLTVQPARLRKEAPEMMIPFKVKTDGLKNALAQFVSGVWLAFDDFKVDALLSRAVPVYLPMWLVDCEVRGVWQAEAGFDYQVKSSQEYFAGSGWQTREMLENRIRWEPRLGQIGRRYDNTLTPAMSNYNRIMTRLGEFSYKEAQAYNASQLDDAVLRVPDLNTDQAWPLAREAMEKRVAQDCQKAAGAQHLRNFSAQLDCSEQHWTQLLLPIYFTCYSDDDGRRYPLLINGQSGAVSGVRLASQRKGWKWAGIIAGGALVIFLLAMLCFALGAVYAPAALLGVVLTVVAFLTGIGAIIPAVWPWQWNRRQLGIDIKETS